MITASRNGRMIVEKKVSTMKVHPVAEMFPMMPEEELDELAEDIQANGLLNPIVKDKDGLLIDGRNRLEACKRASIQPRFEVLNGTDPVAYILAQNVKRRHLSKGQQAMLTAIAYPDSDGIGGRGNAGKSIPGIDFSKDLLKKARQVLRYSPEIAREVISGMKMLKIALAEVQKLKLEAESNTSKMERLRVDARDLYDQVSEESLTLKEAMGAFSAREKEKKEEEKRRRVEIEVSTRLFEQAIDLFDPGKSKEVDKFVKNLLASIDLKLTSSDITKERLTSVLSVFKKIVLEWKE